MARRPKRSVFVLEQTILNAIERTSQSKKFKESGFTPGVLYGDEISKTTTVKFKTTDLTKILTNHGSNAKLWVNYGSNKQFGFIKEVQRHPITKQVSHIDIHLVSQNHEVKMQLPITFKGKEDLEHKLLTIQVYKSEIEVLGKPALMPDAIIVDLSEKKLGNTITLKDFGLDKQIKTGEKEDEVYGIITSLREQPVVVPA
jgi:large subunit ribosomal protein L25